MKIKKILLYAIGTVLILFFISAIVGIRRFHQTWFKDSPNHLRFISDDSPIRFEWSEGTYGTYVEPHDAIQIFTTIDGIPQKFYLQFDTGSPSTFIYGNSLASLQELGFQFQEINQEGKRYLQDLSMNIGGKQIDASMLRVLEDYGSSFSEMDSLQTIKLGTLGADIMDNRITLIDFQNQMMDIYEERPEWMDDLSGFSPFAFQGRRFMLPCRMEGKEYELFYDSGSSAFGLITSKHRYEAYSDEQVKEISYETLSWGDTLRLHHKHTDQMMEIGGARIPLSRISYVNMYAELQRFITPFTRIGGWLGNKPFLESALILDTKTNEFLVLNPSGEISADSTSALYN